MQQQHNTGDNKSGSSTRNQPHADVLCNDKDATSQSAGVGSVDSLMSKLRSMVFRTRKRETPGRLVIRYTTVGCLGISLLWFVGFLGTVALYVVTKAVAPESVERNQQQQQRLTAERVQFERYGKLVSAQYLRNKFVWLGDVPPEDLSAATKLGIVEIDPSKSSAFFQDQSLFDGKFVSLRLDYLPIDHADRLLHEEVRLTRDVDMYTDYSVIFRNQNEQKRVRDHQERWGLKAPLPPQLEQVESIKIHFPPDIKIPKNERYRFRIVFYFDSRRQPQAVALSVSSSK